MWRLPKNVAAYLAMILFNAVQQGKTWDGEVQEFRNFPNAVQDIPEKTRLQWELIMDMLDDSGEVEEMEGGEDVLKWVLMVLMRQSGRGDSSDGALIDSLVRACQLPYAANVFHAGVLKSIRKALLIPDELEGLTQRLSKQEWACGTCGKIFHNNQVAIPMNDKSMNLVLMCNVCADAQFEACSYQGCNERVALNSSARKYLRRKHLCEAHKREAERAGQAVDQNAENPVQAEPLAPEPPWEMMNPPNGLLHRWGAIEIDPPRGAAIVPRERAQNVLMPQRRRER